MLVRRLSTGDVVLFDKNKRELIVVPKRVSRGAGTWAAAMKLVEDGEARHFSRAGLKSMTEALQFVVLLGA